ncbi:MFS transporter [Pseudomonas gingeri]|uniref:MFS transporter n=1 Tax=Pseudomonas gingeri TaxID=117681 RepID=UPI0015A3E149|nr:aromatic acid/H+ symport family MFS transporter [Pseudomonas gingeri]NVZ99451.1 aromatic acid/H+ symport family MFS transporter [Pseudomonas gingeri]NWA15527.1 aromatic acid/H+ symport family MFS transporter [Pseudomonas gingeri]NWA56754.1 aromatic acid/H+ symport family MFS transporter [Pseudomonas gingeri]NWA95248.1 aromatic acid/H+ symport family MFS transporter [Pseudomonas gingeri]NWB05330.1 aromatic acid/H+ symport family MFS transporter [Pseudomonas gingeri]
MNHKTASIGEIIDACAISRYQIIVLLLCFLVVLVDGFDTAVIGYIAPSLRQEWGLQPSQLSPAFGAGLFGLMCGAFLFGPIADKYGRKKVLLVSVLIFSLGTLASAWAHSIDSLTALRFLTGIGLGGAMPTCITLSAEYSPLRRRMIMVTLSYSGFTTGLALGGAVASQIIPAFGWRGVLLIGGLAPLLLLPLLAWYLPESVRYMAAHPRYAVALRKVVEKISGRRDWDEVTFIEDQRPAAERSPISQLFIEGRALRTVLLWGTFFCSLFVFYLLTSWLPSILKDAGYDIANSARIGAMVPLGGTLGAIFMALLMDKVSQYKVLGLAYLGAALVIALVGFVLGQATWLTVAVFFVGFGVAGAQNGLNLLSASIYPTTARATGVSWAMANGRVGSIIGSMLGAWLIAQLGQPTLFFIALAVPALLGSIAIFSLQRFAVREDVSGPQVSTSH